jgi:L-lactate dehydrogenase complex protein LldG
MSTRDKILQAIATNKPAFVESPSLDVSKAAMTQAEAVTQFIVTLSGIGGTAVIVDDINVVRAALQADINSKAYTVNTVPELGVINEEVNTTMGAMLLEPVYKAYISGTLGVAENGAVWLYESQLKNRLLPFICQHLILCIPASEIVPTMHEAYQRIKVDQEGYGVFLAGPSKTADIEQSLVIGAHGARSLLVYILNSRKNEPSAAVI